MAKTPQSKERKKACSNQAYAHQFMDLIPVDLAKKLTTIARNLRFDQEIRIQVQGC